jgi:hypothetical protein
LHFSVALAVFTCADVVTWVHLRYSFSPSIIKATRKRYEDEGDYFGLVKLRIVSTKIIGNWKWIRQIFLSAIVACMMLIAVAPATKSSTATVILKGLSAIPVLMDPNTISSLIEDFLLFLFVAVSEVWHWLYRLRTYWTIRVVTDLEDEYEIRPKPGR